MKVRREDILDLQAYEEQRDVFRQRIFAVKKPRRLHIGDVLTILFENADTMRYQVLEMVRAERLVRESDIERELRTYNALLGDAGEIGCTLLIEIDDPEERKGKLVRWRDLPDHVYARLEDGRKVRPAIDEGQRDAERISAVQFLKFDTGGEVPVAFGTDHPDCTAEAELTDEQRQALAEDLAT